MSNPNPPTEHLKDVRGRRMARGTVDTKVRLSPSQKQAMDLIAEQYGCLYDGKPSLSALLQQLADGKLLVVPAPPPLPSRS